MSKRRPLSTSAVTVMTVPAGTEGPTLSTPSASIEASSTGSMLHSTQASTSVGRPKSIHDSRSAVTESTGTLPWLSPSMNSWPRTSSSTGGRSQAGPSVVSAAVLEPVESLVGDVVGSVLEPEVEGSVSEPEVVG